MKESLYSIQKRPIFRETFESDANTRKLGGVPTAVTYANGTASCVAASSSKIVYQKALKGVYSVRIRFSSYTPILNEYKIFADFRNTAGSGVGSIYSDITTGILMCDSGARYIDGVFTSALTSSSKEILVSGITISCIEIYFNSRYNSTLSPTATYELLEIYEGTLTAQEVANLYNNKRYISPKLTEILNIDGKNGTISNKYSGDATNVNLVPTYDFTSGWDLTGVGTVINSATQFTTVAASGGISRSLIIYSGKKYRVLIKGSTTATGFALADGSTGISYHTSLTGSFDSNFQITGGAGSLYLKNIGAGTTIITSWNIQEIIPTIVNTSVTSVKQGEVNAMEFNGGTSKLDCGSYNTLVGDKTFIAWIKPRSLGPLSAGRILDNGKTYLFMYSNNTVGLTSDAGAGSLAGSAINSVKFNTPQMVVATRSGSGVVNFYINGALSGSANQPSGTPLVGINNLCIGNRSAGDRAFDGQLSGVRVLDGILSVSEIAQLYSTERKHYNV